MISPSVEGHICCHGNAQTVCLSICLLQVVPVSGPLEGGVLVTVIGTNLGMRYQDVVGGVTVAGVQCLVQPEGYQISTR